MHNTQFIQLNTGKPCLCHDCEDHAKEVILLVMPPRIFDCEELMNEADMIASLERYFLVLLNGYDAQR